MTKDAIEGKDRQDMEKKMMRIKDEKGFTLVELIIVIAIIAMLIAMIAPNLTKFLGTATETTLKANAKTAYTSVNAWVTQQRVAGVALENISETNPLIVKLKPDGTALEVSSASGGYNQIGLYSQMLELFNAGEFKSTTQLHIWFTSGYTVTKVVWYEGNDSAAYPD